MKLPKPGLLTEAMKLYSNGKRHANPVPRHLRPERQAYMKAYWARRKEVARASE